MPLLAAFEVSYISPLLPQFLALHPRIKLSLNLTDLKLDLVSAGFDLAIRIGAMADSNLVARRLAPNRRVLCAAPTTCGATACRVRRRRCPSTNACCWSAAKVGRMSGA